VPLYADCGGETDSIYGLCPSVRIRWRLEMRRHLDMRDEEASGDEEASEHD